MDPIRLRSVDSQDLETLPDLEQYCFFDGASSALRVLDHIVDEIAPTDIPVLIEGESGTGKEVFALRLHQLSKRCHEPFLKVVCATLAPEFLDELSRTNGNAATPEGLWRAGTIFLDEISDLRPECQPRLLHLLPNGDALPQKGRLEARLISTTSRDLEAEIRNEHFREELYYRLNGVCLRLPPLRHRKEDIAPLADFFLAKYSTQFGRRKPSLSSKTLRLLADYSWPGNIRQLENVIKKIVALGDEQLALTDFPSLALDSHAVGKSVPRVPLKQAVRAASRETERELILKTLERTRWNRKRAARELQISYKALLYKLKQIGMEETAESSESTGGQL